MKKNSCWVLLCIGVWQRHVGGLPPAVAVARPHIRASDKHTMNGNHSQCQILKTCKYLHSQLSAYFCYVWHSSLHPVLEILFTLGSWVYSWNLDHLPVQTSLLPWQCTWNASCPWRVFADPLFFFPVHFLVQTLKDLKTVWKIVIFNLDFLP